MKKGLIILSILIMFLSYQKSEKENVVIIPDSSLRFRIIASSNNPEDQIIKNKVKVDVEKDLAYMLKDVKNVEESKKIIKENLNEIEETIRTNLEPYNKDFTLNLGYNYFPKKIFKGIIYDEGEYESLVITLGSGTGDNWWCVLFPPLCLLEVNENTEDVEYQFLVSSIINHFK